MKASGTKHYSIPFSSVLADFQDIYPSALNKYQITYVYANEADVLNVALFGMTAKQGHDSIPELKGNIAIRLYLC